MGSVDELKRLTEDFAADEALKAKFADATQRALEVGAESEVEAMVVAAKELGYSVAGADIDRLRADVEQIDVDDLESAAGGIWWFSRDAEDGHEAWCMVTYHCYSVVAHTSDKNKMGACWSDYLCISSSNH